MLHRVVEIVDDGITVWAVAVKLDPASEAERAVLVDKEGFKADGTDVLLTDINSRYTAVDPFEWPRLGVYPRTMTIAHIILQHNFDRLPDGVVQRINVADVLESPLYPRQTQGDEQLRPRPNGL